MPSRSTYLLAALGVAGFLSPGIGPSAVQAGDKIEFSTPNVSLGVPQVARPQTDAVPEDFHSQSPTADLVPDGMDAPAETVYVITKTKKSQDGSDVDSTDNSDNPYGQYKDDAYNKLLYGDTNYLSSRREFGVDPRTDDHRLNDRMNDLRQDNLRGAANYDYSTGHKQYEQDDRFASRDGDPDQSSSWSRTLFRLGMGRDGASAGEQYLPSYQQLKLLNDEFMGTTENKPAPMAPNQPSQQYSSQSPIDGYAFPGQSGLRDSTEATPPAPSFYHPSELRISGQQGGYNWTQPQASGYGTGSREQPAVLPFPKRPGSLFK